MLWGEGPICPDGINSPYQKNGQNESVATEAIAQSRSFHREFITIHPLEPNQRHKSPTGQTMQGT
jgi:hypothetical protein